MPLFFFFYWWCFDTYCLSFFRYGGCDLCWCCSAWPDKDCCSKCPQLPEEWWTLCYIHKGTLVTPSTNGLLWLSFLFFFLLLDTQGIPCVSEACDKRIGWGVIVNHKTWWGCVLAYLMPLVLTNLVWHKICGKCDSRYVSDLGPALTATDFFFKLDFMRCAVHMAMKICDISCMWAKRSI